MTELVKGILGGGWSLVAGWLLPTAINGFVVVFLVLPGLLAGAGAVENSIVFVLAVAAIGVALSAVQIPLYRVLEGYLGWPQWLHRRSRDRQLRRRRLLLERRAEDDQPTTTQRALLGEQLARYPAEEQVVATRLGNAIRRLEVFGFDRYQLDSQTLWYELNAAVNETVRRNVDTARTGVDFFVALLWGHLVVCALVIGLVSAGALAVWPALGLVVVLLVLTRVWYRMAVIGTDEWASAVQALVNVGRKPLAESLGYRLPDTLAEERQLWRMVGRLSRRPYHERAAALDEFREHGDG
ncbi:hypothetical protein [Kutzneria sp. NPDC052558]|uniref:hypothetical protein n=1 Tax=Kutzneria sp. NPDC052558 TaxID=3364121 RepID=UPI0037C8C9FF